MKDLREQGLVCLWMEEKMKPNNNNNNNKIRF